MAPSTPSHGWLRRSRAPFRRQGSADLNLYKLFLEAAHTLLKPAGRLGFVVPSGLYSDNGTGALRRLFLDHCRWEWLFGIENRDKIFPIHRNYKFNPVVVEKGDTTEAIRTAFMRRSLDDWEQADEIATPYTRAQVERFSPRSRAILEIQSQRDLEILEKIYANSVLLGDQGRDGWGIRYATEFHMTNDSRLFPPRPQWEAKGYRPDEYSRWLLGDWRPIDELWEEIGIDPSKPQPAEIELEDWLFDTTAGPERRQAEAQFIHGHLLKPGDVARTNWRVRCAHPPYDRLPIPRADIPAGVILSREADSWIREDDIRDVALPLYEGRMIGLTDFSQKGWVSGKGRQAVWREIPWDRKLIEPQYLMSSSDYLSSTKAERVPKSAYMRVSSSTNSRTTIASYLALFPACDSVFYFVPIQQSEEIAACVSLILSTFSFDFVVRHRLGGLNLSEFVMTEAAVPVYHKFTARILVDFAVRLNLIGPLFARERLCATRIWDLSRQSVTRSSRVAALCMLNALVAILMGLDSDDIRHIFANCSASSTSIKGANAKGFWRVDQHASPELRLTILTALAFFDLESRVESERGDIKRGIEAFLAQNHGEGWMLPETADLRQDAHGEDGRENGAIVAQRLGPRIFDWQLVESGDETFCECHLHARKCTWTTEVRTVAGRFDCPRGSRRGRLRRLSGGFCRWWAARRFGLHHGVDRVAGEACP